MIFFHAEHNISWNYPQENDDEQTKTIRVEDEKIEQGGFSKTIEVNATHVVNEAPEQVSKVSTPWVTTDDLLVHYRLTYARTWR